MTSELTEFGDYASYDDLVRTIAPEVLLDVSDNDYQGDTRLLLRNNGQFGYLRFGWGSCSGCDALQAAEGNPRELAELRDMLERGVHWEPGAYAMAYWLAHRDWQLTEWPDPTTEAFVVRALQILAEYADRPLPQLSPRPDTI